MTINYEAEYDNRGRVPEHPQILGRAAQLAAEYRATAIARGRADLNVSYGPDVGAFFHAERDNRHGLQRRREAGDRRHGAFHRNVVGSRHAAAYADATAVARQAIVGGTARNGVHQIFARERLHLASAFSTRRRAPRA